MISGRGLGHTGGTLDKLDSIPGYDTAPSLKKFAQTVRTAGCAIIGQTAELAPADRRFYAIRDITATVESIPLITASILAKKLAAGLDALVMDVKFGSGAFMSDYADARALAQSIAMVASDAGTPTTALLTDMNQVLGRTVGNALEVGEALAFLTGTSQEPRLREVTLRLAAEMLLLAGVAASTEEGIGTAEAALRDGRAAKTFARMVSTLGGPADIIEQPAAHFPKAALVHPVCASQAGFVSAIDTRAVGVAVLALGGGRRRAGQTIDYAVGLSDMCQPGDEINRGQPLVMIHAQSETAAAQAEAYLHAAISLGGQPPPPAPVVRERIGAR
jgi:thymidine phosphorylase